MRLPNGDVRIVEPSRNRPRLSRYTMPTRQLIEWSYKAQQRNPVIAMPKFVAIALSTVAGTDPDSVSAGDCWLARSSKSLDISTHPVKWLKFNMQVAVQTEFHAHLVDINAARRPSRCRCRYRAESSALICCAVKPAQLGDRFKGKLMQSPIHQSARPK